MLRLRSIADSHPHLLSSDGHPEPWIIAMDCKPTQYSTLDYGLRWGALSPYSQTLNLVVLVFLKQN